jgi:hypothetical protein
MRRLLVALAAVLAIPCAASAKELQSLVLCGQGGACHGLRDPASLTNYERGLFETGPPRQGGPFLRVRLTIGGEEMPRPVVEKGAWLPAAGLLRTQGDDGTIFWIQTGSQATAVLRRLAHGLRPFPAGQLGPLGGEPRTARVDEVVPAPASAGSDDSGGDGGGGSGWAWSLLVIPPVGIAFWLRRRRRGRPSLA